MSKSPIRKPLAAILGLFLLTQLGFLAVFKIPQAQAADYTFFEGFNTTTYKDSANTTANWNIVEGKVTLSSSYPITDWSSYFQNFDAGVTAIANNNYVQMIGGSKGSLNLIPSGIFTSFEDKSNQLVGFDGIDVNAITWSSRLGWLVGGGWDRGSGGNSGPKLNKLKYTSSQGEDLSSNLNSLGFNSVSDIACSNNECLIIGTPGKLAKYDGTSFTDLSSNIDFNTTYKDKVAWNGSYWLIGGTRYYPPESSDYIGKIYKYNGSTFTKITEDTMFVGQGPSIFDMAWNGNEWLIARGYTPIKLYKYNGTTFEDLSPQLNKFVSSGDIIHPTIYWAGKTWLIGGGAYFRHLIKYDGTTMTDVFDLLPSFSGSSIEIIAPKYVTTLYPFLIGGGISSPKLNVVAYELVGYTTSGVAQSKKINTTSEKITEATITANDVKPNHTFITYYLSADGGTNWEQVTSDQQHTFSYPGTDLRWKAILSTQDTATSPYINSISISYKSGPFITVISPNGGENIEIGKQYTITWNYSGNIPKVDIEIWKASLGSAGLSYIAQTINNTGSYAWDTSQDFVYVPYALSKLIAGDDYKIYVRDSSDSSVFDRSDNYFSIAKAPSVEKSITVTSPNGGEEWAVGKTYIIQWTSSGLPQGNNIAIEIVRGLAREQLLFTNFANNKNSIEWTVPENIVPGDYKIRVIYVTSTGSYEADDYSDANFSIIKSGTTGECLPDGTLIKLPGDPKIYVIINCQKKWIRTAEQFNQAGYKWLDVQEVSSPVIEAYAEYLEAEANLLRAIGHERVYRIINGRRLWIPTISAFNAQGLKWDDIEETNETTVNAYPRAKLLRTAGDPKVYYLTESGLRRHFISPAVFTSYNNQWADIVEISATELDAYPDNILIKPEDGHKVYKLENGQKRWIKTVQAFNRLGYGWDKIAPVNPTELNAYLIGTEIE